MITPEEFAKMAKKDANDYKRTVRLLLFARRRNATLARALAWLVLRFANPHGPVAAAARRYEFEDDE